jgi:thiamine-phosphate pyrophosphorylase
MAPLITSNDRIFVAGHRGMAGGAICRALQRKGYGNLLTASRAELDLSDMQATGLRLGLITHGYAEMLRAEAVGPSYLAMGAVYPTTLKAMQTAPQGPHRLAAYARLMRGRPLVAIGGIDETRLDEVARSGVGSIAVVRAVIGASDPEAAATSWMQRMSAFPSASRPA